MRLRQVLRNLLSNALKFTQEGGVTLKIRPVTERAWASDSPLERARRVIAFEVHDTGIGIPKEKQPIIFEAFQQADGGTSRKYGGTGLGLSISREIATLLGGELHVESEPGEGSTFVLYLPEEYQEPAKQSRMQGRLAAVTASDVRAREGSAQAKSTVDAPARVVPPRPSGHFVPDDRTRIEAGDRVLLVIEDDEGFARTLVDMARERGFRVVAALTGTDGLELAKSMKPDAITLDLRLPDMDGWVLLDRLKHDPETRHVPVHVISAVADEVRARQQGAVAVLEKPLEKEALDEALDGIHEFLERRVRRLLVVEDDDTERQAIVELVGNGDVQIIAVGTGKEALAALEREPFDCMVLDLKLPDMTGLDVIKAIKQRPAAERLPIIIYTGKELSRSEEAGLSQLAETIIVKDARSPERLLDETALFLHRVEANLPEQSRTKLRSLSESDPALAGKKVLVVDDDIRNIFAITAVLEQQSMEVVYAENGQEALQKLDEEPGVDVVLMDIMMPEMDGYEAMRRIRKQQKRERLPIIALTAKAMKGDREKCIEAGASDYVTKPVDPDQLLSLLRVWLYR
jgi:hypothetical protein